MSNSFFKKLSNQDRDDVVSELKKLNLCNVAAGEEVQALTKQWCSGKIGNFHYLTMLNKAAGRSFNDLMQYPVAPFILSDYTSQIIDLDNPSIYRLIYGRSNMLFKFILYLYYLILTSCVSIMLI